MTKGRGRTTVATLKGRDKEKGAVAAFAFAMISECGILTYSWDFAGFFWRVNVVEGIFW